jgi:hypothetical protein
MLRCVTYRTNPICFPQKAYHYRYIRSVLSGLSAQFPSRNWPAKTLLIAAWAIVTIRGEDALSRSLSSSSYSHYS